MLAAIRGVGGAVLSQPMASQRLDALLSINNFHAGVAAAANFPALTIPLGLREDGRPLGLTLIAPSFGEQALIDLALPLEALIQGRRMPTDYQ
jgi:amidase